MGDSIEETIAVRRVSDGQYEAAPFGPKAQMAQVKPIAYGGIALSQAITAGWSTVADPHFNLYSMQGSYLGPAAIDLPTSFTVQAVRSTRSFCTRLVTASQNGRNILIVILDWHLAEDGLAYSAEPMQNYPPVKQCPEWFDLARQKLTDKEYQVFSKSFDLAHRLFDHRPAEPGANCDHFAINRGPTRQAHLPLTCRTAASFIKSKTPLSTPAQHAAALAFVMDGALPFLPLLLKGQSLFDSTACAALDFSFRLFARPDMNVYGLHEQHTQDAGEGRTFSIGRWFQDGRCVANMSQSSILRLNEKARL